MRADVSYSRGGNPPENYHVDNQAADVNTAMFQYDGDARRGTVLVQRYDAGELELIKIQLRLTEAEDKALRDSMAAVVVEEIE